MVVYDPAAVKAFYEGTKGSAIPYEVWLKPLGRWFAFYAGFLRRHHRGHIHLAPPMG